MHNISVTRAVVVGSMATALAIAAAACSSSSSGSSDAAPVTSSTASGSGATIGLMMITATGPGTPGDLAIPGVKAAEADVNAAGGVRGHHINITICDDHGNLDEAAACANKAVATSSIVATVGNNDFTGGTAMDPILAQANMASIATKPYNPSDYALTNIFPLDGGGIVQSAGEAEWPARNGAKRIVAAVFDNAGGQGVVQFLNTELSHLYPSSSIVVVSVPVTATDMTPYAAQAISKKPDAIILPLPENLEVGIVQQLRAQGYTGSIIGSASVMPNSALKQLGGAEGFETVGDYSYNSDGYKAFVSSMMTNQPGTSPNDESLNGWLGVHMFANVMSKSSQPLTRPGVLAAFTAVSNYSTDGLTPPLTYTKSVSIKGFTRAFNATTVLHEVKGGVFVDVTPARFLNALTGQIQ